MTLASHTTDRDSLLTLLKQGHHHQFLSQASHHLIACPDDTQIALLVIREYLNLGLIGPARELVHAINTLDVDSQAELMGITRALTNLPDGQVSWSSRQEMFECNVAALRDRHVDVSVIVDGWNARQSDFRCYAERGGADHVRMRIDGDTWAWIPFFGHHKQVSDAQALPEDIDALCPGPYLFDGIGLGHFFLRVYDKTLDTFLGYSCPLYIVEPDASLMALVFHMHDMRKVLADPRVLIFTGPHAHKALRELWTGNADLPFPKQVYNLSQFSHRLDTTAVDVTQESMRLRENAIKDSWVELQTQYEKCDVAYWSKRFDKAMTKTGDPLRILASVSIHTTFLQYSMRDIKRAIESLGHRCVVLQEKSHYETIGPLTYHQAIREFTPDLFLSLDHMRPEFAHIIPQGLPVLTWDQDQLPHVFTDENMRRVAPHDFLVGYSKDRWVHAGCDVRQFLNARVPTCPLQFQGPSLSVEELKKYSCDVSYVSNASQTPQQFHDQERQQYEDPAVRSLLDCMYECTPAILAKYPSMHSEAPYEIIAQAQHTSGITICDPALQQRLLSWYLWRLRDRMYRHEALEWVAAWAQQQKRKFCIYGRGWDAHPTLAPFAIGPADNGRELLCIYRASKINLQLMPAGFIHQRALDGLAAGGFFLTRFVPHDFKGIALNRLCQRIDTLGIDTTLQLYNDQDTVLRVLMAAYFDLPDGSLPKVKVPISTLKHRNELSYPDEVFSQFRDIVFDSTDTFSQIANTFLEDDGARAQHVKAFRDVVVERFSYQTSISTFLRAMARYLQTVAAETSHINCLD